MNRPVPAPNEKVVIVAAKRTPFGTFGGSLKGVSATDLAVEASKAALDQSGVSPEKIEHVIFGNVIPSSSDAAYLARHVGLKSGIPLSTPALTLNRLCGSGFEAIADGTRRLKLGEASAVLVGGTENMSQAPFTLRKSRFGYRMGNGELEDTLVAGLYDSYAQLPMALTAERLAEKYKITREEVDAFSLRSHQLAASAYEQNLFQSELAPLPLLAKDEHVRPTASLDSLKKLSPVFKKEGIVTAGNASGICDGAAALILTLESTAKQNGWKMLASLEASTVIGCEPKEMGIGPVMATQNLLKNTGLAPKDITLIEI
ncbi:acetyl-CoA C-acyltransferase, partial [bacterium]|nr:acetyl-CoA C-acyltransferase [bacterium]